MRIKLTDLQTKAWQSAKKSSLASAARIHDMQEQAAAFGKEIESAARQSASDYNSVLVAIAAEHGRNSIPSSAVLEVEGDVTYFSWDAKAESSAKRVVAKKKRAKKKAKKKS